ncbi:TetR family transcriptional regulator [Kushneria phosphatilytica]|uniref:Cupin domain-containing protein n=2 Tax=Kushneria phosphatilytica TaxID=657387 RepID=A0A1S1NZE0_9GAMM|nr:TetR family transcriptional regulator [Kushneria phosphatilytica]QEL12742.1 cupin domain-containing protein [Kushneria phosphatilytica]
MQISHLQDRDTVVGRADLFTGHALIDPLFDGNDVRQTTGGEVTFAPGARSNWHTHPAGQTLVVTDGRGWIQEEGGEKHVIRAGDVIWTPPGVKHWHGAMATHSMTHIAIQKQVDGSAVEWLEPVSDEEYRH